MSPVRLKKDGTPAKKPGPAKGRKHPGRRGIKITAEMRRDVMIATASKQMTQLDIANALHISHHTLLKHFRRELDIGFAQMNFTVLKAQFETAVKGNASAQDRWLKRAFEQPHLGSYVDTSQKKEPKAPKLGKKEQLLETVANPDKTTSLGERMARRMAGLTKH